MPLVNPQLPVSLSNPTRPLTSLLAYGCTALLLVQGVLGCTQGENNVEQRTTAASACRAHPLPGAKVNSGFGPREDPFTHEDSFHYGIDLGARMGKEVHSLFGGKVTFAGQTESCGNKLVVRQGSWSYKYCHLSEIDVHEGQEVKVGEIVARVGSTGRSTGPHLHVEIYRGEELVDPTPILASADPKGCSSAQADAPVVLDWQREGLTGAYRLQASTAEMQVQSLEYWVDGELLQVEDCGSQGCSGSAPLTTRMASSGEAAEQTFHARVFFPEARIGQTIEAYGYDAQGQLIARGIASFDITSAPAAFVRQVDRSAFETGVDGLSSQASGVTTVEAFVDERPVGSGTVQANGRVALRYDAEVGASQEVVLYLKKSDGTLVSTVRRTL